ncbi:interferon alpha-inducible protein 27-like protein 1 [Stylophora pistillata]|uniref:interferon alpha-inducible protein 27-like protein 1 n=1 Tax=Stylophora pistillata TaxID=50429 RepID=UPI000C03EB62|nr:interferon alpha-inducible protein 27-like protein 1 [Stylophora pistillata]
MHTFSAFRFGAEQKSARPQLRVTKRIPAYLLVMSYSAKFCLVLLLTCLSPIRAQDDGWCLVDYAMGIGGGAIAVAAAPFALSAIGFTTAGVAVGSVAAGIQSAVYGGAVASGSIFAGLQSAGAAGIGVKASAAIFSSVAGAATYIKKSVAPCEEGSKCYSHQE